MIPGLSVTLIAKDAARDLDACLRALAKVADEIVLVDTGSRDETIAIAQQHGARVLTFAWRDDFARARNFAIDQARHAWILSVDTDEILVADGARAVIDAAIARADIPAYLVYQDNLYDDGSIKPNPVARLFQNHPHIRFRNPVHECISESVREHFAGHPLRAIDVHLRHVGYLASHHAGKHARNLAILERWVTDEPHHAFANFKLGHMWWEAGRAHDAIAPLSRTFEQLRDPQTRASVAYLNLFIYVYHESLKATGDARAADDFAMIATEWLAS